MRAPTYAAPLRDRIVSRLMNFIFRFASEDYRTFANAVEQFGRAEFNRHAETLQRSFERRSAAPAAKELPDGTQSPIAASRDGSSNGLGKVPR